jgi:Ca2+-binding RTX toxin-like protein
MISEILSPSPSVSSEKSPASLFDRNPNFVDASGDAKFIDYSQNASGALTDAQIETLVTGSKVAAIAQASAIFQNDPTISELFTKSSGVGEEGAYQGEVENKTQVVANFQVGAGQKFSFNFLADLNLKAKEIENGNIEYNKATSAIAFLVVDTTKSNKFKVVDYFATWGYLISSEQIGNLNLSASKNITITDNNKTSDIDGNNQTDFVLGESLGKYERLFKRDTQLSLIKLNLSAVEFLGDTLIGNLGTDVIYGTIWDDRLTGTQQGDKIYSSLGNDRLKGRNGDDTLMGGLGNDYLVGGAGNDELTGDRGSDRFSYKTFSRFSAADVGSDRIVDFEKGIDRLVLSKTTFADLTNVGDEFATVANDLSAAVSTAKIAYSKSSGSLFYNQNGVADGYGDGDRFATLTGIPELNATDVAIVA